MLSLSRCGLLLLLLANVTPAAAACWKPVVAPDALSFSSEQPDGSLIRGSFTRFDGRLCLDPAGAEAGRLRLTVATASVETGLPELDRALRGPEFFHSERWPQAVFNGHSLERLEHGRYRVRGDLTLRDVTRTLDVEFRFQPEPGRGEAHLQGDTRIRRLDYGIGQGRWNNTRWAADAVDLAFSVDLIETGASAAAQLETRH